MSPAISARPRRRFPQPGMLVVNLAACLLLLIQYLLGMVSNLYATLPGHRLGSGARNYLTGVTSGLAWVIPQGGAGAARGGGAERTWPRTGQKSGLRHATLRRRVVLVCDVTREAAILDATANAVDTTRQDEFGQFMAARWPGLVRLAYGLTGDRWLAEDVAQAALASAYAAWWRVRRADEPDAYVRRILVNTSHRRFRRRRVTEHARSRPTCRTPRSLTPPT